MVIVVMGAAGAGKSTVGALLAARLGYRFVDADALHSAANVERMSLAVALSDEDREGWLEALASAIDGWLGNGTDVVLACSALRRSYRRVLCRDPARMRLVYLRGSQAVLEARLRGRTGHFAGPLLLPSQLQTLEEPRRAITVDIDGSPDLLVERIEQGLARWQAEANPR